MGASDRPKLIVNVISLLTLFDRVMKTTSHKFIGLAYLLGGLVGGYYGWLLSMFVRFEMGLVGIGITRTVGNMHNYNHAISAHGLLMIFYFVMPIMIGLLGNLLIPVKIGCAELCMPRLNGLSIWFYVWSVLMLLWGVQIFEKCLASGWTLYPPLSTRDFASTEHSTDISIFAVHFLGVSSTMASMNMLITWLNGRHKGLVLMSNGLLIWSIMVTSVLLLGSLPMLAVGVTIILLDRNLSTNLYDGHCGGDPVLYQHLFWFFGHPEVYVIILPVFGLFSNEIQDICKREIFGREGMIMCIMSIGIVGFYVWAHHMYMVGMDLDSRLYYSAATSVIAIPTAIKIFSYIQTVNGANILRWSIWIQIYIAFWICFLNGGFSGLILSSAVLDIVFHDTLMVVGHFHVVLSLAATYGVLVLLMNQTMMLMGMFNNEVYWSVIIWGILIGGLLIFGVFHNLGLSGMSRRVPDYSDVYVPLMLKTMHGTIIILVVMKYLQGLLVVKSQAGKKKKNNDEEI